MTDPKPTGKPPRYTVVCPNFVSVFDDRYDAIEHANKVAALGKCRERHTVAQTNLPYGSRHCPEEK
jgi:hypothetical protein